MQAGEWVMANKVKTGLGLIAAIAAVVVLPLRIQAWAEEIAREEALRAEGREQVIHGRQEAVHRYDFYTIRVEQTEEDLIYLEGLMEDGVQLTATQQRKYDKLKDELGKYEEEKEEALTKLQKLEHEEHETNQTEH